MSDGPGDHAEVERLRADVEFEHRAWHALHARHAGLRDRAFDVLRLAKPVRDDLEKARQANGWGFPEAQALLAAIDRLGDELKDPDAR